MLFSMVIPFFLSPFTVHHLGNLLYGIWVLVVSSVAYFNLLDLGLRNAVIRFVAKGHSLGVHEDSRKAVATALWLRLGIGFVIVGMAAILALVFPHVFSIPSSLIRPARLAIIFTALSLACTLAFGVAGAVLSAIHRFDLLSAVNILRYILRAVGFVYLLRNGYGLVALALWELISAVVTGLGQAILCLRIYPELRTFFALPERTMIRQIWGYGFYASLITLAGAVIFHTDNIVVGVFVGSTAVTFYAIAGNLLWSTREAVNAVSATFTPMASGYEASGNNEQLQRLAIQGTRASLVLGLPMCIALLLRGHTFIGLWMGHEYAAISGVLLQILLINHIFTTANVTNCGIAYGMAKHKPIMAWALVEAVINLTISIMLARRIGIYGVAWGTTLAGVICNLLFWPRYISKLLHIPVGEYLWNAWGHPGLAAIPFALACYGEERYWPAGSMLAFILQIVVILPIAILSAFFLFREQLTPYLRYRLRWA